jgi:hypothetical protein
MKQHISFSELKNWEFCPYYHKLVYLDGLKGFKGNIFTAFGKAVHNVCEKAAQKKITSAEATTIFEKNFKKELDSLDSSDYIKDAAAEAEMLEQGKKLAPLAFPALIAKFTEFEVISAEEKLYEPIEKIVEKAARVNNNSSLSNRKNSNSSLSSRNNFKGFIDLVIKTNEAGKEKYIIIDWKTCSWGWNMEKKSDPMVIYQLVLYKHFFCRKHNINPRSVEVYFGLLKRTAKKNQVELLRVTSGKRRTGNALSFMNKALINIRNQNFFKNRLKCRNCEFYQAECITRKIKKN